MTALDDRLSKRPLDASTWSDFARLVEANNGVWGGCWCLWYHGEGGDRADPSSKREAKARLVREGQAHAALVYGGEACVGWCQFGPPSELPRIHNSRAYLATRPSLPDGRTFNEVTYLAAFVLASFTHYESGGQEFKSLSARRSFERVKLGSPF